MLQRLTGVVRDLRQTYREWNEDDGTLLAAAMAYYAALSFLPLLLLLVTGFGLFLSFTHLGQDAREQVLAQIGEYTSPEMRDQVAGIFAGIQENAPALGPVSLLTLLAAAMSIFAQFERAFDRVWNVEDPEQRGIVAAIRSALFQRLRAFLMLFGLGLLVVVVFLAGLALTAVETYTDRILPAADWLWRLAQIGVSVTLNALVFTLIYRVLPKAPVRWGEAARGGALAAVTWEIGRQILASYVIGSKHSTAYGVVGSFLALMLWVYYASATIFFAAEYVQVICKECHPQAGPHAYPPPPAAGERRGGGASAA